MPYNNGMGETVPVGRHNADNILRPLETGVVESFDKLFAAREKTLRRRVGDLIRNKQEFLTGTFPNVVRMGTEHPELSGGVLYMMGILTEHIPKGSEAINSIPRRFAEHKSTRHVKDVRSLLRDIHATNEKRGDRDTKIVRVGSSEIRARSAKSQTPVETAEKMRVVNTELLRARITKELYDFTQCPVRVKYAKDGRVIDLGINSSEVSILNKDSKTGKPMVFLCSSAGNPAGVESYAVEYALRTGNKVIIIGHPDGASGFMTKQFADAAVADANPPNVDAGRQFEPPTYEPHTQFFKQAITTLLPEGKFDLYSHSGGGIMAKNLLNDPDMNKRVTNAVFLNPAGVSTMHTLFPQAFRRMVPVAMAKDMVKDVPHVLRSTFELDRNEPSHNEAFWFRDRVTVAIQSGSHYRQPGWDTMRVNGGKIVLFVGGRDLAVGGKQFASYMQSRLRDKSRPLPSPPSWSMTVAPIM